MTQREREGDAFYNFISKIDEREREREREREMPFIILFRK
jgi:hypothetical protein